MDLTAPSLQSAVALFRSGRLAEAASACQAVLADSPNHPLARLLAGEIAFASGEKTKAADHFRTLALAPATPAGIQHRASVFLMRLGDGANAVVGLKHAARANTFPVLLDLGWAAESIGQIDDAEAAYAAAGRISPGDARPFTRAAVLKLRRTFGVPLPSPPEKRQDASATPTVSMTSLGYNGRFGNQLLQYAFARCYGRVHRLRVEVPEWIGRWLFDLDDPPPSRKLPEVREDGDRLVNSLSGLSPDVFADHDLWGYFCGNTKHFQPHRDFIRTLFTPGQHIRAPLNAALAEVRRRGRTLVAVHLRRGDFGTGRFWIAPEHWYLDWLHALWSSLDKPVLYVATDDANVIRHFATFAPLSFRDVPASVPGAEFLTDFHVLSQADHMAISNSTFSFVAAMLNAGGHMFARPDPKQKCLIPFDPWDSEVLLADSPGA